MGYGNITLNTIVHPGINIQICVNHFIRRSGSKYGRLLLTSETFNLPLFNPLQAMVLSVYITFQVRVCSYQASKLVMAAQAEILGFVS